LETWEPSQHSLIDTGKPRKTCVFVIKKGANNLTKVQLFKGHMVAQLVKALRHKP
jgi:hypothetical protein